MAAINYLPYNTEKTGLCRTCRYELCRDNSFFNQNRLHRSGFTRLAIQLRLASSTTGNKVRSASEPLTHKLKAVCKCEERQKYVGKLL